MENLLNGWGTTLATFSPLVGVAIMMLIPREREHQHKMVALVTSLWVAFLGVLLLIWFDMGQTGQLQFVVRVFVEDGVEYLRRAGSPVDVVVLSHILEHLEEPSAVLRDVVRLCKFVYVEVPDFESQTSNEFRRLLGRPLIFSDLDHIWEFDRREITELLEGAGLVVLETDHRLGMLRLWCSSPPLDTLPSHYPCPPA